MVLENSCINDGLNPTNSLAAVVRGSIASSTFSTMSSIVDKIVRLKLKLIGSGSHGRVKKSEKHENDGLSGVPKVKSES